MSVHRLYLICLIFILGSCCSTGGFKTARPLKKNHYYSIIGVGQGGIGYYEEKKIDKNIQTRIEKIGVPIVTTGLRYGLSDTFELGSQLTFPGTIDFDGKLNFFNSEKVAFSINSGIGGMYFKIKKEPLQNLTVLDSFISLIGSYDVVDYLTLQVKPTLSSRYLKKIDAEEKLSSQAYFMGTSAGFYIKNFFFQVSVMTSLSRQDHYLKQVMIGYWGGWDDLKKYM